MVSEAVIFTTSAFETIWAGLLLSVTLAVKLNVPALVGLPLIIPAVDKVSPAGKVPELMDHV
jgi:hypothetical protein